MAEAEAERRTVAGMGDALLVGGELDRAHRPRPQWRGIFIAMLLIALGLLFQRLFAVEMDGFLESGSRAIAACAGAGVILLFASADYTALVKLAYPALGMWTFFLTARLAEALSMGSAARAVWFGISGNFAAERARLAVYAITPECVCLAMIPVLALLICAARGRGRGGFCVCAMPPLLTGLLALLCGFSGHAQRGMMLLACLGFALLLWAVRRDFFYVNRRKVGRLCGGLCAAELFWAALTRAGAPLGGASEYGNALLRGARLLGRGAANLPPELAQGSPSALTGDLLPSVIHRFGWLPFLLLTAALVALLIWCALRFARMENRMGAMIGMAATAELALQCALFYLSSFTGWSEEFCLPLLSYGNLVQLIDAALIGLLLSALRGEDVPETAVQTRCARNAAASLHSAERA